MRDTLPQKIRQGECVIVNLDSIKGPGTQYDCYYKDNDKYYVFDSFGLDPSEEITKYLSKHLLYNFTEIQERDQIIRGHCSLFVLRSLSEGHSFQRIHNSLLSLHSTDNRVPVVKLGREKQKTLNVPK